MFSLVRTLLNYLARPAGQATLPLGLPPPAALQPVEKTAVGAPLCFPLGFRLDAPGLFTLSEDALARHWACFGSTGTGKSKFCEQLCRYLIDWSRRWQSDAGAFGHGLALLDPAGDLVEDLGVYIHRSGNERLRARTHFVEICPERVFQFDPLAFHPDPGLRMARQENAYLAWLSAEAHRLSQLVCRAMGETGEETAPRKQRLLYDVFVAVGADRDFLTDWHRPLADALPLLDVFHPRHQEVSDGVLSSPYLPPEVRSDLMLLQALSKQPARFFEQAEAAINRLRSLLTPLVDVVFRSNTRSIPFERILGGQGILLVDLRPTRYLSEQVARTLGALFFQKIRQSAELIPRTQRRRFYLILEEASALLSATGQDVRTALQQARKHGLSVGLLGQSIESFRNGPDDNTVPIILNEVGSLFVFQQKSPESRDLLADILIQPNLDFTPLEHEVDRPDGQDWVMVEGVSEGRSTQESLQHSHTRSTGTTTTAQRTVGLSREQGHSSATSHQQAAGHSQEVSRSKSRQHTQGRSDSNSHTSSLGTSEETSQAESMQDAVGDTRQSSNATATTSTETKTSGRSDGATEHTTPGFHSGGKSASEQRSDSEGSATGTSMTESNSTSKSATHTVGSSLSHSQGTNASTSDGTTTASSVSEADTAALGTSKGVSLSDTHGRTDGTSTSFGQSISDGTSIGESLTQGDSEAHGTTTGTTQSVSRTPVPIQRYRTERQATGQLRVSVADQKAKMQQRLATLALGQAQVLLWGEGSFPVQVVHVEPVASSPQEFETLLHDFKERNAELHDYLVVPDLAGLSQQEDAATAQEPRLPSPRQGETAPADGPLDI